MAKKQGPMQGPAPVYKVRDPKPKTGAAKAAQTRAGKAGVAKREAWEATPTGQSRMATPSVMQGSLPPSRVYAEMGFHDNSTVHEHQATLPGMGSLQEGRDAGLVSRTGGHGALPDVVPVARWHHLSSGEKMDAIAHAAKFGVTRDSAKRAFAANLDQAFVNAHDAGASPHARDFYVDPSPHMPAGHIIQASRDSGHDVSSIATGVSVTSPQTEWGPTTAGEYPNIRAARHAAMHDPAAPLTKAAVGHPTLSDDTTKKVGTFTGNVVKAAGAIRQHAAGISAGELKGDAGNPMFGGPTQQKTTAFRTALVDPEGPHASFVSDVHSGGRGMAPHLPPTEAGEYLKHPAIHQWHDDIAREVMRERGLQSINNTQAAQWGQAQLDSGQVKPERAFPRAEVFHDRRQGELF